jgi:hypothetical protein
MVIRDASKGGASGRVCAGKLAKFPASKRSAASVRAAFHGLLQSIASSNVVWLRVGIIATDISTPWRAGFKPLSGIGFSRLASEFCYCECVLAFTKTKQAEAFST